MYFLTELQGVSHSAKESQGSSTEVHESVGINCSAVSDMYFPLVNIKLIIGGSDTTITRNYTYYLVFLILICIKWWVFRFMSSSLCELFWDNLSVSAKKLHGNFEQRNCLPGNSQMNYQSFFCCNLPWSFSYYKINVSSQHLSKVL